MTRFHSSNRWNMSIVCLGALLVAGTVGTYFAGIAPFAPSHLEQAQQAATRGDLDTAMKEYFDHLATSPTDNTARLELAELLKPIDAATALDQFQKIPSSASEYSRAIWHIAHIATVGGDDVLAEDALKKLDEVHPGDFGVVLSLAELYYRTARYQEALPWTQQAVKLQPERAQIWLLLAEVLDHLNRTGEMPAPLQTAIKLNPDLYVAHANLAYALQFSGRLDEAEQQTRWCLDRKPNDISVRRWLAMILRDRGHYDKALEQIRKALSIAQDNIDCRIVEADLLLFQRKSEEAYNSLKPLYTTYSGRRDFLGSLARAAAMSGRRDESRQYQREIVVLIEQKADRNKPMAPVSGQRSD